MAIREIVQKLNGVRKGQNGFIARCPAHDDKQQSLSIGDNGGKVLLRCFAGCPPESIIKAMGIEWKDLFHDPKPNGGIKRSFSHDGVRYFASPQAKVAAVYRYTDETGNRLYENVRYEPKGFRQRCFDTNGNAIWSLDGVRRVPYRLPELVDKARHGGDVWLCEGEKDADSLAELGFVASSFKNWLVDFNQYVRKTNVVIVRDHDLPGGVQANEAARIVAPATASVKVLDVHAEYDMPEKHGPDISDYVRRCVQDEGMTREEIAERLSVIADGNPRWVDVGTTEANLFVVKTGNEWLKEAKLRPSPRMLFGEFWFQGELCILFADTNVGKSILAVQIGDAISRGNGHLSASPTYLRKSSAFPDQSTTQVSGSAAGGEAPNTTEADNGEASFTANRTAEPSFSLTTECPPQTVVYFDFELTDKQFEGRVSERVAGAEHCTNHYSFHDNFKRAEVNPETSDLNGFKTFEEFLNHSLDRTITEEKADVLIIDNLTYLRDETENARNALPLMKYLKELKSRHGISILALAHTPKRDSSKPIGRNDLQGSKMLINFCDSSFAIGESHKDPGLRYLKQIKVRNAAMVYHSENVLLGNLERVGSLLQFVFNGTGSEYEHLKARSDKDKEAVIAKVKELAEQGKSSREIAEEFGISQSTVTRYLRTEKA